MSKKHTTAKTGTLKVHKYSAFVLFKGKKKGKMEFSNSLLRLVKLILVESVAKVIIRRKHKIIMQLTRGVAKSKFL